MKPQLSVVIPTLNEEACLRALLKDLKGQEAIVLESIVVDGGSTDQTREVAEALADRVVQTPFPHRAKQLNAGASVASAEWLLFLHADSTLGDSAVLAKALAYLQHTPDKAGHFGLKFEGPKAHHPGFRYLSRKTAENRRNTTNGDQGFLMHRELFWKMGGFDEELPFLEDQRLAEKIRRHSGWVTLPDRISTSTRRFAVEGFGARYTLMAIMMGVHDAGIHQFFDAAKPYVPQDEAQALDLRPFLQVIKEVTGRMSPKERWNAWYAVGKFIRQNAWQIALALDVYFGDDQNLWLELFDEHVEDLLTHPFFDVLATVLAWSFFRVGLPTYLEAMDP